MNTTPTPRKIAGFELLERWLRGLVVARPVYAAAAFSSRRT